MLSMFGDSMGKIRSTPTVPDILRTVKRLLVLVTIDFDNNTAIQLDTLFVTFDDFVCYGNRITCFELRELLACSKSFFSNLN